jgi:acetyl-CoA acetyltransferase
MTKCHAEISAHDAFTMAGLTREHVDVAEIYDCFTPTVLLVLEGLGYAAPGQEGKFVEDGNLRLGGKLPANKDGELRSFAHPGLPTFVIHMLDTVRQLRGESTSQVKDAQVAIAHGIAGLESMRETMLLGK